MQSSIVPDLSCCFLLVGHIMFVYTDEEISPRIMKLKYEGTKIERLGPGIWVGSDIFNTIPTHNGFGLEQAVDVQGAFC